MIGTPYIECVNGTLVVSTLNHVLSQLKINIQINILFRKQNWRLPTHTDSLHVTFIYASLQMASHGFSFWSFNTRAERVNWASMCVRGEEPSAPPPSSKAHILCCWAVLPPPSLRSALRGQSVCKFPSSFPLSLSPCLSFPTPVYITLSFSLWLHQPGTHDCYWCLST